MNKSVNKKIKKSVKENKQPNKIIKQKKVEKKDASNNTPKKMNTITKKPFQVVKEKIKTGSRDRIIEKTKYYYNQNVFEVLFSKHIKVIKLKCV